MNGISLKLSASAVTATIVGLLESLTTSTLHWQINSYAAIEVPVLIGAIVGYLIRETAIWTNGVVTLDNTDPAPTPTPPAVAITPDAPANLPTA